jgi:hypothetical protein
MQPKLVEEVVSVTEPVGFVERTRASTTEPGAPFTPFDPGLPLTPGLPVPPFRPGGHGIFGAYCLIKAMICAFVRGFDFPVWWTLAAA